MNFIRYVIFIFLLFTFTTTSIAHEISKAGASATYLGNAALLVTNKDHKILFDPFFHQDFGIYRLVPKDVHQKIMAGEAPYDNIDAVFISHAHDDHFDVGDVVSYMQRHNNTQLVVPEQALVKLQEHGLSGDMLNRVHAVSSSNKSYPQNLSLDGISINAIPIPHAGYPYRFKDVENILFHVTLGEDKKGMKAATVIHLGDAGDKDEHFLPYKAFWEEQSTDISFPPYWFLMSAEGRDILNDIIKSKRHIGIHVPKEIPSYLEHSGEEYFSKPGKVIVLKHTH